MGYFCCALFTRRKRSMFTLFIVCFISLLAKSLGTSCPESITGLDGAYIEDPSVGCLFADGEEGQQFDQIDKALNRCRELMGANARLVEVLSAEDQGLAQAVMAEAEGNFEWEDPKFSYWWSGLQDVNDDGIWIWPNGGPAVYTNWYDGARPNVTGYNCMQFMSASFFSATWTNLACTNNFISS